MCLYINIDKGIDVAIWHITHICMWAEKAVCGVRAKRFRVRWVLQVTCRGKRMFMGFQHLGFLLGSRFKI